MTSFENVKPSFCVVMYLTMFGHYIIFAEKFSQEFTIETNMTISADINASVVKAKSALDCARICTTMGDCCKASFIYRNGECFLDETVNCSIIPHIKDGSILLRKKQGSCKDIYQRNPKSPSGIYIIYYVKPLTVYCSFQDSYGYTFLSKKSVFESLDISYLYDINSFAVIRHRTNTNAQKQVKVQQLDYYASKANLSFAYNSNNGYTSPQNKQLGPYLFLGFIPYHLANQSVIVQGYKANGVNYTFTSCDKNPNSYIAFYLNPNKNMFGSSGSISPTTLGWITSSNPVETDDYMADEFYFEFEIHQGGCGGFLTTASASGILASLGKSEEGVPEKIATFGRKRFKFILKQRHLVSAQQFKDNCKGSTTLTTTHIFQPVYQTSMNLLTGFPLGSHQTFVIDCKIIRMR